MTRTKLLKYSTVIVKDGKHEVVKDNKYITLNSDLDIYKENGKVVISKKSGQLGVVYLETEREIRKVASKLREILVKIDEKSN